MVAEDQDDGAVMLGKSPENRSQQIMRGEVPGQNKYVHGLGGYQAVDEVVPLRRRGKKFQVEVGQHLDGHPGTAPRHSFFSEMLTENLPLR